MSVIVDPKLGINVYAPFQSNQWEDSKKARRWLSFFASRVVMDTSCTVLPASPAEGDTVLMSSSYPIHASEIARYSTELMAWEYMAPWAGLTVCDTSGNEWYFSGSAWVQNPTAGISALATTVSTHTAQIAALQAGGTGGGGGGVLVGRASASRADVETGSTIIPSDDTIPQITEGTQFLTLSYTPKLSSSVIVVRVEMCYAISTNDGWLVGALFRGSATDAVAAVLHSQYYAWPGRLILMAELANTDGSVLALSFRAGLDIAGTLTMNGKAGARKLGGSERSWITVEEYAS